MARAATTAPAPRAGRGGSTTRRASGAARRRAMVRYGTWGSGLFQSIYEPAPGTLASLAAGPGGPAAARARSARSRRSGSLWSPLLLAAAALPRRRRRGRSGGAVAGGWQAHPPVPGRSRLETLPAPRHDRAALPAAAGRPPGRAAPQRPLAVAPAPAAGRGLAAPAHGRGLERKLARAAGLASQASRTRWPRAAASSAAAGRSTAGTSSCAPARSAGSRSAPRSRSTARPAAAAGEDLAARLGRRADRGDRPRRCCPPRPARRPARRRDRDRHRRCSLRRRPRRRGDRRRR